MDNSNLQPTPPESTPARDPFPAFVRDLRPRGIKWSIAARALVAGKSTAEAAREAQVSPDAVRRWTAMPKFQAIIEWYQRRIDYQIVSTGVASKRARQRSRDRIHRKLERIIEARALDALNPDSHLFGQPGADTGLLHVSKLKVAYKTEITADPATGKPVTTKTPVTIPIEFKTDATILAALESTKVEATKDSFDTHDPNAGEATRNGRLFILNFPVLTAEEVKRQIDSAQVIDMPTLSPRVIGKA